MKRFTYLLVAFVVLFVGACKKGTVSPASPLIGKWNLVANYVSTGDPGTWIYIPGSVKNYVEFDNTGTLSGNAFTGYSKYAVKDSVTVIFSGNNITAENYSYKVVSDTLTMSPAGPNFCIEGCGMRFFRSK